MTIRNFLQQQNIQFSLKRYAIDALNFMALGLFSSLIIGLILKNLGTWADIAWLVEVGTQAQKAMGAAIGVGVAYALQAPPLVLLSSTITGLAGAALAGPVGCFFAAAVGAEFGKLVSKVTVVDIIVTPAVTLCTGVATAQLLGAPIATLMNQIGGLIMWSVELQPLLMGMVVAVVMGIVLTLPISSAAIAISLSLSGLAAGAATVGCCCQMIGFATMSFKENRWGGLLSQGLGTSMLQMPNIIRNPKIWLPPIISSAILGPVATLAYQMSNIPSGAGMGTSGLVGQIGTIDAMGNSAQVWLAILGLHFILPAVLTLMIAALFRRKGWIKAGDLALTAT
ncbi:PTS transporter subunit IIC [Pasteurella testudinis]|uniref:PTS transporter subunit IIC n=1 Tax=Pasteurella testudinis TaxID=761 RepID=UPI004058F223